MSLHKRQEIARGALPTAHPSPRRPNLSHSFISSYTLSSHQLIIINPFSNLELIGSVTLPCPSRKLPCAVTPPRDPSNEHELYFRAAFWEGTRGHRREIRRRGNRYPGFRLQHMRDPQARNESQRNVEGSAGEEDKQMNQSAAEQPVESKVPGQVSLLPPAFLTSTRPTMC